MPREVMSSMVDGLLFSVKNSCLPVHIPNIVVVVVDKTQLI